MEKVGGSGQGAGNKLHLFLFLHGHSLYQNPGHLCPCPGGSFGNRLEALGMGAIFVQTKMTRALPAVSHLLHK